MVFSNGSKATYQHLFTFETFHVLYAVKSKDGGMTVVISMVVTFNILEGQKGFSIQFCLVFFFFLMSDVQDVEEMNTFSLGSHALLMARCYSPGWCQDSFLRRRIMLHLVVVSHFN